MNLRRWECGARNDGVVFYGGLEVDVLVVAAHPDDEVLGCGGTIAKLSADGHSVSIGILGEGVTSRFEERGGADAGLVDDLHDRCRQAAKMLGANEPLIENFPDNRFDTVPLLEIIKTIEKWVAQVKPQLVYTHSQGDLNVDHSIVFRATLTALRPVSGCPVRSLYTYEVPSSTEWAMERVNVPFRPNTFVDISETLETKISALKAYESEVRAFPHPRSPEALRAIAQRWGMVAGLNAAEAFELIRSIKL